MARKHYRAEEIIAKLREAEVLLGQGMKVPEAVKAIGIHEQTYDRWRREYGGLELSQVKRLKALILIRGLNVWMSLSTYIKGREFSKNIKTWDKRISMRRRMPGCARRSLI